MPAIKLVHVGGIDHNNQTIRVFVKENRIRLIKELNEWFFDHLLKTEKTIRQLPPLDDWQQGTEDFSFWSVQFPTQDWTVWIRNDFVDFK